MSEQTPAPSTRYAWYVVAVLMVAYVFSFIDRQILSLLVGPIRADLAISDTQISLLMGFSFAIFYSVCGIPIGRLADTRSRRGIVAVGIFFWSVMTAACGLVKSYGSFFLCRVGVGVGEATLSPSAYSLIADYFRKEDRATAISVYGIGIYLGSGIAFLLGGLIVGWAKSRGEVALPLAGAVHPWQLIFLILGAAGAAFTLVMASVREPVRQGAGAQIPVPLGEVLAYLDANRRAVLCHSLGFALLALASYGSTAWVPTFFIRSYGWSYPQIGAAFGALVVVSGTAGIVAGGRVTDRLLARGVGDAHMRVGRNAALGAVALSLLFPAMPDARAALVLLAPLIFLMAIPFGIAPAAIQEIMPNPMRAQASAVYLFIVNLIGLGLGPTAVALLTDRVFHDDAALRYSLQIVTTGAELGAALTLALGLGAYRQSLQRLGQWTPAANARP